MAEKVEAAAKIPQEEVNRLYKAGILSNNAFIPRPGLLSGEWDVVVEVEEDQESPFDNNSELYNEYRVTIKGADGISRNLWFNRLMRSIILDPSDVSKLSPVQHPELKDQLFWWESLNGVGKEFKEFRFDGGIVIPKKLKLIGGLISESKIPGLPYKVPFYGMADGLLFLEAFNANRIRKRKSLRESEVLNLLGREYTTADGRAARLPNVVVTIGDYGRDPYLSPITPIFEEFDVE